MDRLAQINVHAYTSGFYTNPIPFKLYSLNIPYFNEIGTDETGAR